MCYQFVYSFSKDSLQTNYLPGIVLDMDSTDEQNMYEFLPLRTLSVRDEDKKRKENLMMIVQ